MMFHKIRTQVFENIIKNILNCIYLSVRCHLSLQQQKTESCRIEIIWSLLILNSVFLKTYCSVIQESFPPSSILLERIWVCRGLSKGVLVHWRVCVFSMVVSCPQRPLLRRNSPHQVLGIDFCLRPVSHFHLYNPYSLCPSWPNHKGSLVYHSLRYFSAFLGTKDLWLVPTPN